ncbi:MAG TPA: rubrerythrin family protein [Terracidiphilus sp.]|nr:rubrerythrin family protein [Terracidiphilus sp.]
MMFASEDETVIRNLQAAYEGESNAQARYRAFAVKADAEGFAGIASLFRAASRAEQIHASNQARALRQIGGEAKANIAPVNVQGTLENLNTALKGEQYEIDVLYPKFVEQASAHINAMASRAFGFALEAEKTHAELYKEAIAEFDSGKPDSWISTARNFQVCPVCAYTSLASDQVNCAVCGYPAERFETIA